MSIYKIVPSSPAISLTTASEGHKTLDPSFLLLSSALDTKDGFIHMSTSSQVPQTLKRFFPTSTSNRDSIYLFKVSYDDVTKRDDVEIKWETPEGKSAEPWIEERGFPHIYLKGQDGGDGYGLAVFGGTQAKGVVCAAECG
ncbi:hypothetical protein D9758_002636 [Tetrapyrgos nigripes]|uniref:DUF952 domain protein n=1 Tax=Tetrapyrgos nigripes TaxID=182062 RepID=A0A8H5GQC5_9AGAR|nr:hypothetical protein D9758_002636 [Tetrapyrgos nigripes]